MLGTRTSFVGCILILSQYYTIPVLSRKVTVTVNGCAKRDDVNDVNVFTAAVGNRETPARAIQIVCERVPIHSENLVMFEAVQLLDIQTSQPLSQEDVLSWHHRFKVLCDQQNTYEPLLTRLPKPGLFTNKDQDWRSDFRKINEEFVKETVNVAVIGKANRFANRHEYLGGFVTFYFGHETGNELKITDKEVKYLSAWSAQAEGPLRRNEDLQKCMTYERFNRVLRDKGQAKGDDDGVVDWNIKQLTPPLNREDEFEVALVVRCAKANDVANNQRLDMDGEPISRAYLERIVCRKTEDAGEYVLFEAVKLINELNPTPDEDGDGDIHVYQWYMRFKKACERQNNNDMEYFPVFKKTAAASSKEWAMHLWETMNFHAMAEPVYVALWDGTKEWSWPFGMEARRWKHRQQVYMPGWVTLFKATPTKEIRVHDRAVPDAFHNGFWTFGTTTTKNLPVDTLTPQKAAGDDDDVEEEKLPVDSDPYFECVSLKRLLQYNANNGDGASGSGEPQAKKQRT